MGNSTHTITPTSLTERIIALDVLRGFAILGIFQAGIGIAKLIALEISKKVLNLMYL